MSLYLQALTGDRGTILIKGKFLLGVHSLDVLYIQRVIEAQEIIDSEINSFEGAVYVLFQRTAELYIWY